MAINGIQGKPGGGKSYEAVVNHIIPTVTNDKRKVVTNLPLQVEHFCNVYGEYCRDLIDVIDGDFHNYGGQRPFSKKEHFLQYEDWENEKGQKVLFVIDECHLSMGKGSCDKELLEFFSMHRHYGFDILLITQNFRKVHQDIRDMVTIGYRAIKKSMMGQDDKYILKVHDGASQSNQSVVNTFERVYEKRYFPFYQSHTKSDKSVQEATTKDIRAWWKHWTILSSFPVIAIAVLIIVGKLSSSDSVQNSFDNNQIKNSKISKGRSPVQQKIETKTKTKTKTIRQLEYEEMLEKSKTFHPFYKVHLSVSGYADYNDRNLRTKIYWLSASQNGQHVFTISTRDLMLAGYDVSVLSDCAIKIKYYDYKDYLTCDAPTQSTNLTGDSQIQTLASNN
jgi:zona occludens toxin